MFAESDGPPRVRNCYKRKRIGKCAQHRVADGMTKRIVNPLKWSISALPYQIALINRANLTLLKNLPDTIDYFPFDLPAL